MSFFKEKFKKKDDIKENSPFKFLASDEKIEDKTTDKVDAKPITFEPTEKKPSSPTSKEGVVIGAVDKPTFFKRIVDKKLTIILIENTFEVVKEKDTLIKIIKNLASEGLVSVINYGTVVRRSDIFDISDFDNITFLCNDDIGNMACLYDALAELESFVSEQYMHIEEKEKERVRINKIEVIGIGTCKDNCSKVSKQVGIDSFCKVLKRTEIMTKYFCLTEETFMDAAEIGFRSIGAIFRNY